MMDILVNNTKLPHRFTTVPFLRSRSSLDEYGITNNHQLVEEPSY
jgi:hypothetical protein